jgi:cysteine synthase A
MNPGGSVKDRAARGMIEHAEKSGALKPGGTIIEGTAGNTGISLAMCGNARGYKTIIVMPETQSQEKKDMLRLLGAALRLVPAKPYKDPGNYVRYSEQLAIEMNDTLGGGVMWANQFDNIANQQGHYQYTAPEIWEQTSGRIDGFTCSVGSGGTIGGISPLSERTESRHYHRAE